MCSATVHSVHTVCMSSVSACVTRVSFESGSYRKRLTLYIFFTCCTSLPDTVRPPKSIHSFSKCSSSKRDFSFSLNSIVFSFCSRIAQNSAKIGVCLCAAPVRLVNELCCSVQVARSLAERYSAVAACSCRQTGG